MVLYRTGRSFEKAVSDRLFRTILQAERRDWYEAPPELVLALIELFNWFGKLVTDHGTQPIPGTPNYDDDRRTKNDAIRAQLTQLCIDELRGNYAV
ncbi:MAG: hypothetical protein LC776_00560 [Acidobacteria bacterium]|nr:hypothetical protein [Acidobacteriota bacterium]